ncbi:hypothetical protein IQ06DRAFT_2735 [Phaeosphaeriaceae sp. SRC1lsM3a]|nr:hypothetical protein IQ06DRAFT_2735 [Stagonospora sp. SRC1lsM3a]
MHSLNLLLLAASSVVADELHLYLGEGCRNAQLGTYAPVEEGLCIKFDQAQSYILEKDDGVTYNLYSGGGCGQYEGQVSLSGKCLGVGTDITGLINIGKQDRRMIRGATRESIPKAVVTKRVDGDTMQCSSLTPYYFVVQSSAAVHEEIPSGDERTMQNNFMADFNAAYQNPSGQTEVSTYNPYDSDNIEDPQITLDMVSGVIQDFQPQDMEDITRDLFTFRDQQRSPVNFIVQIFSGRLDLPDIPGGLLATFNFNGER